MLRKVLGLFLLVICAFSFGGCGENSSTASNTGYTVTDSRGKELYMKEKPKCIVCTYVFADEILLDLVSHDRIVGMDKWVHDPGLSMAVHSAKDIITEVDNSAEHMVALRPDLVVVGESQVKLIQSLEGAGLPVFVYKDAKLIKDIPNEVRMIGKAVWEAVKTASFIATLEERLQAIDKKVAAITLEERKRVMLVLRFGPVGGEGSIFYDVLTRAGCIDVYTMMLGRQLLSIKGHL